MTVTGSVATNFTINFLTGGTVVDLPFRACTTRLITRLKRLAIIFIRLPYNEGYSQSNTLKESKQHPFLWCIFDKDFQAYKSNN